MKLPEWMTARYEDGQIKGCTYGSLEYWHEKGHELLKNNEVWSITKIWGEACAMSAFFGFAYSWGDGGIIFAKIGLGILATIYAAEEVGATAYSIKQKWVMRHDVLGPVDVPPGHIGADSRKP